MIGIASLQPHRHGVYWLAAATFVFGAAGMAASFWFLASSHPLDVVAGAAGFVAGSLLASAGLVALSLTSGLAISEQPTPAIDAAPAEPPVDVARWLAHFNRNQLNRPEPDWTAPITLPADAIAPFVRSLEQFQLGDGGGPAYLIAHDREKFLAGETRVLVNRWFAEEREHSRLLAAAVARFGGRCIQGHWSFTVFCLVRRWLGVRFELTVLLLTEIVSTVYYRLLRRHSGDPALRSMCWLILRDESGHVAFHRDRLASAARIGRARHGKSWEARFRLLGLAAATMLWVNHAPGLRAIGATGTEFYREVWRELSAFVCRLRQQSRDRAAQASAQRRPFDCRTHVT